MSDEPSPAFERGILKRMLATTQESLQTVSACYSAGLVPDISRALTDDLLGRGIQMSPQWIDRAAEGIRRGEPPVLPSLDELYDEPHA